MVKLNFILINAAVLFRDLNMLPWKQIVPYREGEGSITAALTVHFNSFVNRHSKV